MDSKPTDQPGRWRQTCRDCQFSKLTYGEQYRYSCELVNPFPLGDWIARVLRWCGVTQPRYLAARGRLRVVGGMNCTIAPIDDPAGCGCVSRQTMLNQAGRWLYFRFRRRRPIEAPKQ